MIWRLIPFRCHCSVMRKRQWIPRSTPPHDDTALKSLNAKDAERIAELEEALAAIDAVLNSTKGKVE